MHKLYKTIQVETISRIIYERTSSRFIMILHIPLNMLNVRSIYIHVEDWMKFQFAWHPDNPSFWPLNGQYINGHTTYAVSPISLYNIYFPSINALPTFVIWKTLQSWRLQTHQNSKSQDMQFTSIIHWKSVEWKDFQQ